MKTQVLVVHPHCIRHLQMGASEQHQCCQGKGQWARGLPASPRAALWAVGDRNQAGRGTRTDPWVRRHQKGLQHMGLLGFSLIGRIPPRGSPRTTVVSFCASLVRRSGSTAKEMHPHSSSPLQAVCFLILPTLSYIQYLMQDNPIFKKT